MNSKKLGFVALLAMFVLCPLPRALALPQPVPRSATPKHLNAQQPVICDASSLQRPSVDATALPDISSGTFLGGSDHRVNLETIRRFDHSREGFERWTLGFSSVGSRRPQVETPRFQLKFQNSGPLPSRTAASSPCRLILLIQAVQDNFLNPGDVSALTRQSRFVRRVILYPPIEHGDMAVEFVLKDKVMIEPVDSPSEPGKLILDMRHAPVRRPKLLSKRLSSTDRSAWLGRFDPGEIGAGFEMNSSLNDKLGLNFVSNDQSKRYRQRIPRVPQQRTPRKN